MALILKGFSSSPHRIRSEEVSADWGGQKHENVLIVGVCEDRAYRAGAETALAEEPKSNGIDAQLSFDINPNLDALDSEEDVAQALAGRDNDAILSAATIDPDYDFDYEDALATRGMVVLLGGRPAPYTDLCDFVTWAGSDYHTLRVALQDPVTQRPLWQATTNSQTTGSASGDTRALAGIIVDALRQKACCKPACS